MQKYILIPTVIVLLLGCVVPAKKGGTHKKNSFVHKYFPYKINYTKNARLMPREWRLDNYQVDDAGQPDKLKEGPNYMVHLRLDVLGDGVEKDLGNYPIYDLRFTHRRTDGKIWLRSLPVPPEYSKTKLKVLLQRFTNAMSGADYTTTHIGRHNFAGTERRFATRVLQAKEATVSGQEAVLAIIEHVNLDQVELSPDSARELIEIAFIRTDYLWTPASGSEVAFPVLMLVGYTNLHDDFESGRRDFRDFLRRLRFSPNPKVDNEDQKAILSCAPELEPVRFKIVDQRHERGKIVRIWVEGPELEKPEEACINSVLENSGNITDDQMDRTFVFYRKSPGTRSKTALPQLEWTVPLDDPKPTPSSQPTAEPTTTETEDSEPSREQE